LVACATARNPAHRYADAIEMGAELESIAEELALPEFRVPAPRDSAQHRSAALYRSCLDEPQARDQNPPPAGRTSVRQPTRQLTRGPDDWPDEPDAPLRHEYHVLSGKFAGIEMSEFIWARQHAQRMVLIWVAVVLAVAGLVAAAAWTIGSNLSGLL
jgi:serine/threonine-protein kinase